MKDKEIMDKIIEGLQEPMMTRIFDHPNMHKFECLLCGGKQDRPVLLIPIVGTQDGHICETIQVHHDCLLDKVMYYKDQKIIIAAGK